MRYEIVKKDSAEELQTAVNAKLKRGFHVSGGVMVDADGKYAQALTHPLLPPAN